MKQLFIPTDEIPFRGSLEQLLSALCKAGGKVQKNCRFTCPLPVPGKNGIEFSFVCFYSGGFLFFRVEGEYKAIEGGFLLRYRVVPTFLTVATMLLPIALAIAACRQFAGTELALYPLWIASMVTPMLLLMLLWERTKEIDRFREIFKSKA